MKLSPVAAWQFFRAIAPPQKARDSKEERILQLVRENGVIMRRDVESCFGVSQTTAGRLLKKMVDAGLLRKEGNGKNTEYYLFRQQ